MSLCLVGGLIDVSLFYPVIALGKHSGLPFPAATLSAGLLPAAETDSRSGKEPIICNHYQDIASEIRQHARHRWPFRCVSSCLRR